MRYMGSKNKLSKELVPIIQSYIKDDTKGYIEPFVGGANIIDKVVCHKKIGCDSNKVLIELLNYVKNIDNVLPDVILEDEYIKVKNNKENYDLWYLGFIGFCASFGAKYFNGYARDSKNDNSGSWSRGAIKNIEKQRVLLKDIKFINSDFRNIPKDKLNSYVIYCDIPYKNTTKYKTGDFPYEEFYDWCEEVSRDNVVLISEYTMPEDRFKCIWSKEVKNNIGSGVNFTDNSRIEKLWVVRED